VTVAEYFFQAQHANEDIPVFMTFLDRIYSKHRFRPKGQIPKIGIWADSGLREPEAEVVSSPNCLVSPPTRNQNNQPRDKIIYDYHHHTFLRRMRLRRDSLPIHRRTEPQA
jgi:hypothetical protein